jgi:hypothetical protein
VQYNNRAVLARIASAINPLNPEGTQHGERTISHTVLAELETTPDRYGLTTYMVDGRQFQITVEEVL